MPNPTFDDLPILTELGDQLAHAYTQHERYSLSRSRVRFVRPRAVLGLATVATAAVVVALLYLIGGSAPAHFEVTVALQRVADIAQAQPNTFPSDRQFTYTKLLTTSHPVIRRDPNAFLPAHRGLRDAPTATVTSEEQVWVSADRTGLVRSHTNSVRFPNAAARRLWIRDGRPSFDSLASGRVAPIGRDRYLLGNISLTRSQLLNTTTDPHQLYDKLYAAGHSPGEVFTEITDTLRDRPAPPRLRGALYRALALVPGVQLLGPVHDQLGREGTAFAISTGDVRNEVIVDPNTGQTLEERTIATPIITTTTYVRRAITNTTRTP